MDVKEKIAQIKERATQLAVQAAAVLTLMGGTSGVSSCTDGNNQNTDKNKDTIENVEKTSVVFRSIHNGRDIKNTDLLLENGDSFYVQGESGAFLEAGDTVTYETKESAIDGKRGTIKAVRYKDGTGKQVNFGQIAKMRKDITD